MFKPSLLSITLLIGITAFISCTDKNFDIGEDLIPIKSDVIVIDTFTLPTYTIRVDSFITSGYSKALVGSYTDGNFGRIISSSFLQFDKTTGSIAEWAVYDSAVLRMKSTGYYYGDTMKPFRANLYRINEDFVNADQHKFYYNTSKVGYDSTILLGSCSTLLRPYKKDTVSFKMSDDFGQTVFKWVRDEDDKNKTQANFISKILAGLAVVPDKTDVQGSVVYQFNTSPSTTEICIYYHIKNENGTTVDRGEKVLKFASTNQAYQFNNIKVDYSNSPLKNIRSSEGMLSSNQTDSITYLQAGTGILTRIEFPQLGEIFKPYNSYKILKAQLILRPVKRSFEKKTLPDTLFLIPSNKYNKIGGILFNSNNQPILPSLNVDEMYNETAYYFDITNYINSAVSSTLNESPSLIISNTALENSNYLGSGFTLERAMLGNSKHPKNPVELKITFWKYSK